MSSFCVALPDRQTQCDYCAEYVSTHGSSVCWRTKIPEKAFKHHGRQNGCIKGEEASGAITVGLRYGASIGYMHYTRKKTLNAF